MVTGPTVTLHKNGIVSVSGMVIDATGERLETLRIMEWDDDDTDDSVADVWREHVARIGARPV